MELEIDRFSVSSNSQDIKSVVDAVSSVVKTEMEAIAEKRGIQKSEVPEFTIGEVFKRYTYRCWRVRPKWYQHIFTLKTR
jgi:hypothetical protein